MRLSIRSPIGIYALAVLAVVLAATIRFAVNPLVGTRVPYATFYVAVVAVAFLGRLGATLLVTVLSAIVGTFLFAPRGTGFWPASSADTIALVLFVSTGGIVGLLASHLSRMRERLQITATQQAAEGEKVRVERARLQDIINSIPGVVWESWDEPDPAAHRTDYVSNHVERMIGYSPEEWTSSRDFWLQLVPQGDRDAVARKADEAFARDGVSESELRWTTRNGPPIWVMARSSAITNDHGRRIGTRGVAFDVTDRKKIEQRLALLAEISTSGLVTPSFQELAHNIAQRTAAVVGDYCIVRMFRDGRLDGVASAHVAPEAEPLVRQLMEHPDVIAHSRLYADITTNPRTQVDNDVPESAFDHIERRALDGIFDRFRARRSIIAPLLIHGRLLGTLALGRAAGPAYSDSDVRLVEAIASRATLALDNAALFERAQRDATEAQIARAEAEEAGRVKDEFLATLSHELRTPLNAILGWAHMLRDPSLPAERRQAAIDTIVRNAQSQEQLISDILDVQRIMAGKIRLNQRSVDLGAIIRSAAETVQPAAASKSVRLQLLVDLDVPTVWGDPDRLQQVVWNLLSNAIKFAPHGGYVHVRLLNRDDWCELVVQDNGPGIEDEFIPFVFERFRQADSSTTRTHKGLGLGLAIVRSLVEMHGGTIAASNLSGNGESGAVFTIRLPRHAADARPEAEERPPTVDEPMWLGQAPPLDGLRVLVVEDDTDARELIGTILERCGANVTLTGSEVEGFQSAADDPPDVIVSDIEMPEEDGYGFIRRIRALAPEAGGDVPAAALTAYASPADRMKVLGAGFNIHVAKPVQPAELAMVVASLAGRRA